MGWSFGWDDRKSLINHLTTPKEGKCLAHCLKGNNLWMVYELSGRGHVLLYLLRGGSDWGYKGMSEEMGPYYYNCPLKYLDLVPLPDGPYAKEWREKVREYHRKRNRPLEVGITYRLIDCKVPMVRITGLRPLRGEFEGVAYKLTRDVLGEPEMEFVNIPY